MSIGIQLSADSLLSNINRTSYYKSFMSYAIINRFKKEAFPDPNSKDPVGHRLEPADWVF